MSRSYSKHMDQSLVAEVQAWIADDPDPVTASTLQQWLDTNNEAELRTSFSGFLQFGTAGLRAPVRPGPSGMNRAVVGRTAAGIVAYMRERNLTSVIIGRDARYGSEDYTFGNRRDNERCGHESVCLATSTSNSSLSFCNK